MGYELKGKVVEIGELKEFKNDFRKVDIVLETGGDYSQFIKCEAFKKIADSIISDVREGDILNVLFDLKGNEYNGKYYTNVVVYKYELETKADIPVNNHVEPADPESLPF
jgi:single-strand DNA-binding protein